MLKSILCDFKKNIPVDGAGATKVLRQRDRYNKEEGFQSCALLTDCITIKNNTKADSAKDLDVVVLMYNLILYNNNYSKTFECL